MRTIYLRLKEQVYLIRKPCKIAINGDGSSKAKALNSCEDTVCDTSSIQCREWIEMLSETLALALLTYDHLCTKSENGLTLRERQFLEEYSQITRKQGKDTVIRRENKTKRQKKKNRP